MTSQYVDIKSGLGDILTAATGIVGMGQTLDSDMNGLIEHITAAEGDKTWGTDEFAKSFLDNGKGGYHHADGGMCTADAVKALGRSGDKNRPSLGATAQDLGNYVINAMQSYAGTDDDSATDIGSVAGQV
jgi:hypothetical protein